MKKIGFVTCAKAPLLNASDKKAAEMIQIMAGWKISAVPWDQMTPKLMESFDGLVLRSTWDYHRRLPEFNKWLDQLKIPVLNPPALIRWNQDKSYLEELGKKDVPVVPTRIFKTADLAAIANGVAKKGWTEVVMKPAVSASGELTYRVATENIPNSLKVVESILARSSVIVQPFLPEIQQSGEISAIYFKGKGDRPFLSHAVLKRPTGGDFRVQTDFGGSVESFSMTQTLRDFCQLVLSKVPGEWLYARVDFIITSRGPLLGELEMIEPFLFLDEKGAWLQEFVRAIESHFT